MTKEVADTRGDAEFVAVPKTHSLSFISGLPRSKSKVESSSRPSLNKPNVVDDNTPTGILVRYICADQPREARSQAQKKGIQLQNTYGPQGRTVLHMAAAAESMVEVLRKLLGRPDVARHVNRRDNAGRTALHEAAILAMPNAILDELIDAGASTDIVDQQLLTPLHAFIIENRRPGADGRVFKSLVEDGGAEVNTKNSLNDTPLHEAARRDNEPLIRLLLRHGADPDSVNADGKTPQALLPENSATKRIFLEPRAKWNPRNLTKIPAKEPLCEGDRRRVCESFYVTVWFYYRPESLSWSQTSTVYSVIYDKDTIPRFENQFKEIIQNSSSSAAKQKAKSKEYKTYLHPGSHNRNPDTYLDGAFEVHSEDIWKWIHLPANNMTWVKDLIYRLTFSDQGTARLGRALKFVDRHIKEHKDNRGYFRLPHVEEERRDDDLGVGDDDDNDMAGSPLASPSITSSTPPTSGSEMNQHNSNSSYFPPVENPRSSPPKIFKPPKTPEFHETHRPHARSKLPNEAWRSQKVTPKSRRRLSLVIPYFDFETELYLNKGSASKMPPAPGSRGGAGRGGQQFDRMTALEQHYPPFGGPWGLQLPQTLDESYYHMLRDDELQARNRDQIIYKRSSDVDESGIPKTQLQDFEDEDKRNLYGMVPVEANDDSLPQNGAGHQTDHNSAPRLKENGTAADTEQGSTTNRDQSSGKDRKERNKLVRDSDGSNKSQNITRTHRRKLLVVHQLWLWKLDENTVITSHPERWHTGTEDTLFETIRQSGIGEFQEPDDLIEHIVSECARFIEEYRYAGLGEHILEIFENSIAIRSNQEVECFKRFIAQLGNEARNKSKSPAAAVAEHSKAVISSSNEKETITEETKLIREIKDIRDELRMLGRVLKDQAKMVERFAQLFWPDAENDKMIRQQFTDYCGIQSLRTRTTRLDDNAHQTLLDLYYLVQVKQAQSSLHEAITATVMSKRAQTLNDYILVFTTITVIFTPLAFMTSLFALPINSFPQKEETGTVSYTADWFAIRITIGELVSLTFISLMVYTYFTAWRNRGPPGGINEPPQGAGPAQPVPPADSPPGGSAQWVPASLAPHGYGKNGPSEISAGAPTEAASRPTRRRVTSIFGGNDRSQGGDIEMHPRFANDV